MSCHVTQCHAMLVNVTVGMRPMSLPLTTCILFMVCAACVCVLAMCCRTHPCLYRSPRRGSAECVRRLIWANADVCAIEEDHLCTGVLWYLQLAARRLARVVPLQTVRAGKLQGQIRVGFLAALRQAVRKTRILSASGKERPWTASITINVPGFPSGIIC